jgi:hypothetical protein
MGVSVEVRWFGRSRLPVELVSWFHSEGLDPTNDVRVDDYFTCSPEFGLNVRGGEG